MSISDDAYLAWLKSDGQRRELLVEAVPSVGGVPTTRYLSRLGYATGPADSPANTTYDPLIAQVPAYSVKASELFTGRTLPTWAELQIMNERIDAGGTGALDSWLNDSWDGRAITMLLGDASWARADFRSIFTGAADDIYSINPDRHGIRLRGRELLLNKRLQTTLISGTSTASDGQPVPIAVGPAFNCEPRPLGGNVWQVHGGQINAISAVRVNGVAATPSATNLAAGTFTLSGAAGGRVTCDVQGAAPGGSYLTTTGAIIQYLLTTYAGLSVSDIDTASIAALDTAAPYVVARYWRDAVNVMDALDELVTSVGAAWSISRDGKFYVWRLAAPTGSADLTIERGDLVERGLRITRRILPHAVERVAYGRNWTVQSAGELAAGVSDANRALYSQPYQIKTTTNSVSDHLMAPQPAERQSLISGGTDAQTECDRVAALYSTLRYVYGIQCMTAPGRTNLGDEVSLTHPRYGFSAGANAIVTGITESPTDDAISLEVFA